LSELNSIRKRTLRKAVPLLLGLLVTLSIVTSVVNAASVVTSVSVGNGPTGLGVNVQSNDIYVANTKGNTVTVINGRYNTIESTIPVGSAPTAAGVNPMTSKAYITNVFSNTVTMIFDRDHKVGATISVPTPLDVAVNPATNKIYVLSGILGSSVYVIDGNVDQVTAIISVPDGDAALAVNPATNRIYVSTQYGCTSACGPGIGSVVVIDGLTNSIIANVATAAYYPSNFSVGVNPATNRIYQLDQNGRIFVIDGSTNTVITSFASGYGYLSGVSANPLTNRIYVTAAPSFAGSPDYLLVIDGSNNAIVQHLLLGGGGFAPDVAVNTKTDIIYVTNPSGNYVSVIAGP
jgi:YVTN family beta-propeller protein